MSDNRILIIDDQAATADLIAKIAVSCGYIAEVAPDAEFFLHKVETWAPTHIVLDLKMPDVDGIALLRLLAERNSRAKIVIASGMDGKMVEIARRLGVERNLDLAATVLKPFRRRELFDLLDRLRMEASWRSASALAAALEQQELFVVYQPKIELSSGIIVGFEGLVRWRHPKEGVIPPDQFLPIAEDGGLIERLTDSVVDLVLKQLRDWGERVSGHVAINLSSRGLCDVAFTDQLIERCNFYSIDPARLALELTETSAMQDALGTTDILTRLRLKGFGLALDDFGTGYSSLMQLVQLPFSEIKIDKSFVANCVDSRESRVIIKSTVDLAHNLNLRAVAEGVETEEICRLVTEMGCDAAQGYYFAKPLPADQVLNWIGEWQKNKQQYTERMSALAPVPDSSSNTPLWSKPYDNSAEVKTALAELLAEQMNPLWELGRNSLVGWRLVGAGIEVLMVPYRRIVQHFGQSRRLLQGRRLMGDRTFQTARELAGCAPVHIALPFAIGEGSSGAVPTQVIETVLRRYGITETLYRGVSLFDIVGFSRYEPSRQVAQLNSLECSINTAQKLMAQIGKSVNLARTTTGDGFYMWNREKGPQRDTDTYLLTLLALADNALARKDGGAEFVPELRACFAIGPHYSYYQVDGLDPRGHDYIVGDVTIGLARMISKCLPGQILVRDFHRPASEGDEPINPIEFMIQADGAFARFNGVTLQGKAIDTMRCYLTGSESTPGAFDISRYTIRDKHGYEHPVFNQKFNVYLRDPGGSQQALDKLYLGLRQADLTDFEADLTPLSLTPSSLVH